MSLLSTGERRSPRGAVVYDLAYDLTNDYTHKIVRNSVCVDSGRLYILNLQYEAEGAQRVADAADAIVAGFAPGG